jgi:hypothetical protein
MGSVTSVLLSLLVMPTGREGDKRGNNNNDNSDDEFIFLHTVLFSALRSAQIVRQNQQPLSLYRLL